MVYSTPNPAQLMPNRIMGLVESLDLAIASKHPVPEIGPLLEKSVLAGGKRLRPTLCYLMGGIFEIPLEKMSPFARVSEFVHGASLAHDDVLDMAERRRDKPTINALSSNYQAVLSGDFLIATVIKELSELNAFSLIGDLSQVMEYLVYGEWLQEGSRADLTISHERLHQIAEFKTASLIGWCCIVSPRLLKMDEPLVSLCREFGIRLGIGFQMVDDVIDFDTQGDKDFARDLKNGFINFVTWELLQQHPSLSLEIKAFLEGKAMPSPAWRIEEVDAARRKVRQRAWEELRVAQTKLNLIVEDVLGPRKTQNPCAQSLFELIELMGLRSF